MDKETKEKMIYAIASNLVAPKAERKTNEQIWRALNIPKSTFDYQKRKTRPLWTALAHEILKSEKVILLHAAAFNRLISMVESNKRLTKEEWELVEELLGLYRKSALPTSDGAVNTNDEVLVNLGELSNEELEIKISKRLQKARQANNK